MSNGKLDLVLRGYLKRRRRDEEEGGESAALPINIGRKKRGDCRLDVNENEKR